jgi:hypothetical protein
MKLVTIVLASVFALSSTFALAHSYHRHHHHYHSMNMMRGAGNPNGSSGGRTTLSGTGPSTFGGQTPGPGSRRLGIQ